MEEFGFTHEQLGLTLEEDAVNELGETLLSVFVSFAVAPTQGLSRGRVTKGVPHTVQLLGRKGNAEEHARPRGAGRRDVPRVWISRS